jgi:hypothetical protein
MPPVVAAYVTYHEIYGERCSFELFEERLKEFPLGTVLRACSMINSLLATWTGTYNENVQSQLIQEAFPPALCQRLLPAHRPVFHRQQAWFVAQKAIEFCDDTEIFVEPRYWGGLGLVLLMASDQLDSPVIAPREIQDKCLKLVADFLPIVEANGASSYLLKLTRSSIIHSTIAPTLAAEPHSFDIPGEFQAATGLPLPVYQALVVGAISRFGKLDGMQQSANPGDFALPANWFRSTAILSDQIDAFFADTSTTRTKLKASLTKTPRHDNDFTLFRSTPLIRDTDAFFPIDFSFLAEKLESGPFWRVHKHLPPERRDAFHSYWGRIFERYINFLLEGSCGKGGPNVFYADPRYARSPDEQVCDGIIISGRSIILLEYKGSTFTSEGKYGGNLETLRQEIETKLVGTVEKRKGVLQLVKAVETLGPQNTDRIAEGIDLSGIAVVFPVLITRDDIGSCFGMNAYLDHRFQELRSSERTWRSVTPLLSLSADDTEKLSPFLRDTPLDRILAARCKTERSLLAPFWTVGNREIEKKGQRHPDILKQATRELFRESARILGLAPPLGDATVETL